MDEKFYYVYDVEWSQTDKDTIVIHATSKTIAQILKRRYPNARFFHLVRVTDLFHNN